MYVSEFKDTCPGFKMVSTTSTTSLASMFEDLEKANIHTCYALNMQANRHLLQHIDSLHGTRYKSVMGYILLTSLSDDIIEELEEDGCAEITFDIDAKNFMNYDRIRHMLVSGLRKRRLPHTVKESDKNVSVVVDTSDMPCKWNSRRRKNLDPPEVEPEIAPCHEDAPVATDEDAQESKPEDAPESKPEDMQKSEPEDMQKSEPEDTQKSEPEDAQESEPEDAQESEPEDAQESEPEDAPVRKKRKYKKRKPKAVVTLAQHMSYFRPAPKPLLAGYAADANLDCEGASKGQLISMLAEHYMKLKAEGVEVTLPPKYRYVKK